MSQKAMELSAQGNKTNILKGVRETGLLLFVLDCDSSHVQQEEIKNWTTGWRNKIENNLGEKICMWESKKSLEISSNLP